jgi:hypothetical protein
MGRRADERQQEQAERCQQCGGRCGFFNSEHGDTIDIVNALYTSGASASKERFLFANNPQAFTAILAVAQRAISTFMIRHAALIVELPAPAQVRSP